MRWRTSRSVSTKTWCGICNATSAAGVIPIQGRLILAGGGGAQESRLLDEKLAEWLGPQGKMVYLPLALRGLRPYELCYEWITATFTPLGLTKISMWTNLSNHRASELDEFEAVYIGGGNTYSLLAQFLESGFDRYIVEYLQHGRIAYGGSAGAVLLGKDIRTVSHNDVNEIGLTETNGLNLLEEHSVWVHYQPQDDELIFEYSRIYNQPVLAISEGSGIVWDEIGMYSCGFEPAYRFDSHGKFIV